MEYVYNLIVIIVLASSKSRKQYRRMLLLITAITVHNIPEGLAVGVAFAGNSFESARNLAIAIGLQNFPEGIINLSESE